MELSAILIIVNMALTLLYPITKMVGRIRHSKCMGMEVDIGTPPKENSVEDLGKKI
jgi:hypothetical protein